ncbi:MAG: hypothetical protein JO354_12380 [Verrucomicrobia bacterium]|nr:hypothetical protein [Verrucomicrobiota bacterium]
MNEPALEQLLESEVAGAELFIGEVVVRRHANGGFELRHRDDSAAASLPEEVPPSRTIEIAKFDDAGKYRPLRTAPTLRRGWKVVASDTASLIAVLDALYPARLAVWRAWRLGRLATTPLRDTLNRQSGIYRAAARISDASLDELVRNFCRSDGGCLRTIFWRRDRTGEVASTKLPPEKFDPAHDQTGRGEKCIPLLCQEACGLLVSACAEAVKSGR